MMQLRRLPTPFRPRKQRRASHASSSFSSSNMSLGSDVHDDGGAPLLTAKDDVAAPSNFTPLSFASLLDNNDDDIVTIMVANNDERIQSSGTSTGPAGDGAAAAAAMTTTSGAGRAGDSNDNSSAFLITYFACMNPFASPPGRQRCDNGGTKALVRGTPPTPSSTDAMAPSPAYKRRRQYRHHGEAAHDMEDDLFGEAVPFDEDPPFVVPDTIPGHGHRVWSPMSDDDAIVDASPAAHMQHLTPHPAYNTKKRHPLRALATNVVQRLSPFKNKSSAAKNHSSRDSGSPKKSVWWAPSIFQPPKDVAVAAYQRLAEEYDVTPIRSNRTVVVAVPPPPSPPPPSHHDPAVPMAAAEVVATSILSHSDTDDSIVFFDDKENKSVGMKPQPEWGQKPPLWNAGPMFEV